MKLAEILQEKRRVAADPTEKPFQYVKYKIEEILLYSKVSESSIVLDVSNILNGWNSYREPHFEMGNLRMRVYAWLLSEGFSMGIEQNDKSNALIKVEW